MGRAEKRQQERTERIESKKSQIVLTPAELLRIRIGIADEVRQFDVDALLTCFAQVMYSNLFLDGEQIMEVLEAIDELFGRVMQGELSVDEMKEQLEKDVGIKVVS